MDKSKTSKMSSIDDNFGSVVNKRILFCVVLVGILTIILTLVAIAILYLKPIALFCGERSKDGNKTIICVDNICYRPLSLNTTKQPANEPIYLRPSTTTNPPPQTKRIPD